MSQRSTGASPWEKAGHAPRPPVMSLKAAARYLGGRSETTVRQLLATGKIKAVRDGKRLLPTTDSCDEYLRTLPVADVKPTRPVKLKQPQPAA